MHDAHPDDLDIGSFLAEAAPNDLEEDRPASPPRAVPQRRPTDLLRAFRPREKLFARGARSLSHGELVTLVLGAGSKRDPAAVTADRLLRRHSLAGLAVLGPQDLAAERGLGCASAARIAAAFELGRRLDARRRGEERPRLTKPREVHARVRSIARARKEHLVGLYLDAQNGLLHQEVLSVGSLNTTRTHPREILFPAVTHLALGFILAHNHPSGSLEPSPEDLEFTRSVQRAGELMGIELYDHVIVAGEGYVSLREMGMM